jgi:uncharacterized protein YdaU (DUF1376 family)
MKAAYRLVLDLIYMQAGRLPDDERYISGLLGCSVRAWKKHRAALISAGKIYAEDGIISNFRADKELETSSSRQEQNAENRRRSRKINDLQKRPLNHAEADTDTDITTASAVVARAPDFDVNEARELERRLREAACAENLPYPSLFNVGPIYAAMQSGANLEIDILPVIRAKAAKGFKPQSWGYYSNAIAEAVARRRGVTTQFAASLPTLAGDDADWLRRLRAARATRQWSTSEFGPMPGHPGCRVPERLLEKSDGDGWTEWRAAS